MMKSKKEKITTFEQLQERGPIIHRVKVPDGGRLFFFASNPTGEQVFLEVATEEGFEIIKKRDAKYGCNGKMIGEVILDGNTLTVRQSAQSVVLQKGEQDLLLMGKKRKVA